MSPAYCEPSPLHEKPVPKGDNQQSAQSFKM